MALTYFTSDGSYGGWDSASLLIDTSMFTEDDWAEIADATDMKRVDVAWDIYTKHWRGQ